MFQVCIIIECRWTCKGDNVVMHMFIVRCGGRVNVGRCGAWIFT